jgi:thiamine-phosphate diphosphorylase
MLTSGIYALLDVDRLGCAAGDAAALERLVAYAAAAQAGGAIALQLRYKSAPLGDSRRAEMACALVQALRGSLPLFVDDDVEAAKTAGCGVHLGQGDASPAEARRLLGPDAAIGFSTHHLGQVDQAQALGVQYLGFGPVRPTVSKLNPEPVTGWAQLSDACRASDLPVVAIGGLEAADAWTVRACGAAAMAVVGAWLGPASAPWSPEEAFAALTNLDQQWRRGGDMGREPQQFDTLGVGAPGTDSRGRP